MNPDWKLAPQWMQTLSPAARNNITRATVDAINNMAKTIIRQLNDWPTDYSVEYNEGSKAGGVLKIVTPACTHVFPFELPPLEVH